ncbi:nose resistant to fluoxetine protein 6-like [Colletes gigas]|uniref:nose resistant to fluoxetine protein 6-like n=1 Tax=Colletes gigas TaxID=935657 RepID=UPI001C9B056F|nr:nose resistant to fluoxetine protein 6-like [Colletes gigas]
MRAEHLLLLLFTCWSVNGLDLAKRIVQFDNDESKTNSEILQTNYDNSVKNYVDQTKVVRLNVSALDWDDFVNVWSPHAMARLWNRDDRKSLNISTNCDRDVTDYTEGLSMEDQWALKMADSSGKYTWALFSGNVFWLGFADQCREMGREFVDWRNNGRAQRKTDVPPFLVSMTSVSFSLKVHRTGFNEVTRSSRIILGMCLPDSCGTRDVRKLFYFVQDQRGNDPSAEVTIEAIRNLSKGYSFWDDPVFYLILGVLAATIVFVILGTLYDVSLRYQVLRMMQNGQSAEQTSMELKILNVNAIVNDEITFKKLWAVKEHNGTLDINNSKSVPKPLSEALLSFSLLLNLSKVFSLDVGADTLAPIHGLRFISMLWVILLHTCLTVNVVSDAKTFKSRAETDFLFQTISNGTYAVDTFFFISGCLVSFLYFRTISKDTLRKMRLIKGGCGQVLQFLGVVWYRYFRLTPPYLLVIGLIQVSMPWYYDHTMLDLYTIDYYNCRKFWWRNILYINTYFEMEERCMVWSWYLANDTLFYIIGMIILIIGARYLPAAAFMTVFFLIVSWATTAIISWNMHHVPSIKDPFAHYESLYDKPWSRIGPYLLGMIAGWYLFKSNCAMKVHKTVALGCWIFSFVTMLTIVYGLYGNSYGRFLSAAYTALSHSGWAACVGWILIACVTGNGGPVNRILSWKYLYPLSRLSYCVYLVHPAIIRAVILHGEASIHLTNGLMAILFFGFTVASYAVGLVISLLFEAPMVSLLRIVHPMRRWKTTN